MIILCFMFSNHILTTTKIKGIIIHRHISPQAFEQKFTHITPSHILAPLGHIMYNIAPLPHPQSNTYVNYNYVHFTSYLPHMRLATNTSMSLVGIVSLFYPQSRQTSASSRSKVQLISINQKPLLDIALHAVHRNLHHQLLNHYMRYQVPCKK